MEPTQEIGLQTLHKVNTVGTLGAYIIPHVIAEPMRNLGPRPSPIRKLSTY